MRYTGTIMLWALVSALVILVITLPINLQTQLIASIAVIRHGIRTPHMG